MTSPEVDRLPQLNPIPGPSGLRTTRRSPMPGPSGLRTTRSKKQVTFGPSHNAPQDGKNPKGAPPGGARLKGTQSGDEENVSSSTRLLVVRIGEEVVVSKRFNLFQIEVGKDKRPAGSIRGSLRKRSYSFSEGN